MFADIYIADWNSYVCWLGYATPVNDHFLRNDVLMMQLGDTLFVGGAVTGKRFKVRRSRSRSRSRRRAVHSQMCSGGEGGVNQAERPLIRALIRDVGAKDGKKDIVRTGVAKAHE